MVQRTSEILLESNVAQRRHLSQHRLQDVEAALVLVDRRRLLKPQLRARGCWSSGGGGGGVVVVVVVVAAVHRVLQRRLVAFIVLHRVQKAFAGMLLTVRVAVSGAAEGLADTSAMRTNPLIHQVIQ